MSEPLTAAQRVAIARHPQRPNITDYIQALFTDFFEQKGDRLCGEDAAILGGVALYHGRPVTVIGTRKGKTLEENLKCNFGMPNPEGYRKALRLMRQAEKFRRPILTFIDTSGAYPGLEAEAHGQGEAIARNLYEMSRLTVPVIALITGEGNSGGALALGVANRVLMLENSVYAILSPEGFASILWKDSARHEEACELMKLTAPDLLELGVIDGIIPEPEGGAHLAPAIAIRQVDQVLRRQLADGTYFTVLLALLTRHVRQLWQAKVLMAKGVRGRALAKPLELNPFIAEKLGRAAASFKEPVLKRAMLLLIDADYLLKTGQAGNELLEEAVITLCKN